MPRFLVELESGAETAAAQTAIASVQGVREATPTRAFGGLIVTADAGARQQIADQPGVARVYDDIQAVPQVADEQEVQDFLDRVREVRGPDEAAPLVETEPTEPSPKTDGGRVTLPELQNVEQFVEGAEPQFSGVASFREAAGIDMLHERGLTGDGVIVVVLDTGVADSQFAASRQMDGLDLTGEGDPWSPIQGHGTMSAGIAAGGPETDGASPGFAPDADVYPIKSTLSASELIQAMDDVIRLADSTSRPIVVNSSWGFTQCEGLCDHPVTSAIDTANNHPGVYHVLAAGNQGNKCGMGCSDVGISGPNSLNTGLTVAATGRNGNPESVMPYSSRGGRQASCGNQKPDLAAPVYGTVPWGSGTRNMGNGGGTSAAAPQVAGSVAALLSGQSSTPAQSAVFDSLRNTVVNFRGGDWDGCIGFGNLQAAASAEGGLPTPVASGFGGAAKVAVALAVGGAAAAAYLGKDEQAR